MIEQYIPFWISKFIVEIGFAFFIIVVLFAVAIVDLLLDKHKKDKEGN